MNYPAYKSDHKFDNTKVITQRNQYSRFQYEIQHRLVELFGA